MKVPYVDLPAQYSGIKTDVLKSISALLDSGMFILGDEVKRFEESFAKICNTKFAVGVANGTDSLVLSLKALGIGSGDEVITVSHSYLASASSIALAGATPVLVDVDESYNMNADELRKNINSNTKAIIVVHLTGMPANMDEIMSVAKEYNVPIIEDAAQAVGAKYKGKAVGSLGKLGSFSLHPLKNLAAAGDAGIITTNDEDIYNWLIKARNHGLKSRDELEFWSFNSRLDALQAAILNSKLPKLNQWNIRRREIANRYINELKNLVGTPDYSSDFEPVFHAFVITTEQRDELQEFLAQEGVDTKIHYPIPIHLQEGAKGAVWTNLEMTEKLVKTILSLPVYPELTDEQVTYVIDCIKRYFNKK